MRVVFEPLLKHNSVKCSCLLLLYNLIKIKFTEKPKPVKNPPKFIKRGTCIPYIASVQYKIQMPSYSKDEL